MGYTVVRRLARRTKRKLRVSVEVLVLNFGFARLASSSLFFCMPNDNDGLISGTRKRSHCTICIRTEQRRSNCLIVECFCFDCVAFKMVAPCNSHCLIRTSSTSKIEHAPQQADMARCSVRAAGNFVRNANRLRCQRRPELPNRIACALCHLNLCPLIRTVWFEPPRRQN